MLISVVRVILRNTSSAAFQSGTVTTFSPEYLEPRQIRAGVLPVALRSPRRRARRRLALRGKAPGALDPGERIVDLFVRCAQFLGGFQGRLLLSPLLGAGDALCEGLGRRRVTLLLAALGACSLLLRNLAPARLQRLQTQGSAQPEI